MTVSNYIYIYSLAKPNSYRLCAWSLRDDMSRAGLTDRFEADGVSLRQNYLGVHLIRKDFTRFY